MAHAKHERWFDAGAISASASTGYDLTKESGAGSVPQTYGIWIDELQIVNGSDTDMTARLPGQRPVPIRSGAPATLSPGGRIEEFTLTAGNAAAVSANEIPIMAKGWDPHCAECRQEMAARGMLGVRR